MQNDKAKFKNEKDRVYFAVEVAERTERLATN